MKKLITAALAIAVIAGSALVGTAHAAGSASFSLSPASGSYTQGNSFSVQVHENGSDVNVVTAKLTYDAGKLTCTGVAGGGAFPNSVVTSCSGGSVTISRYTGMDGDGNPTTVSGDQVVGTVNFTAAAPGNASVAIAAGSQIASNGSNIWNGSTSTGSYTISAPVTTTPSNPSTGSTGGSSSSAGSSSSNSSAPSTSNSSTANKGATKTTTGSTNTTATPAATGETKDASTTATTDNGKKATSNSTKKVTTTASKKSSSKAWMWIVLVVIVAAAAAFVVRKKLTAHTQNTKPATQDAKPKAKASKK